ncbi:hypothetical protein [Crateriforma spongiae]|uniref:hypothetical protein n=1 Tax=Crateriforma spongiae TaxID=2724528 RepID=UPI0014489E53|nr:hypothetical protein [Crateriforma spongiae]
MFPTSTKQRRFSLFTLLVGVLIAALVALIARQQIEIRNLKAERDLHVSHSKAYQKRFTLNATMPAEILLQTLCDAISRDCVIEPSAAEACKTTVAIDETNATIASLIYQVAHSAGVSVDGLAETVTISRTPTTQNGG